MKVETVDFNDKTYMVIGVADVYTLLNNIDDNNDYLIVESEGDNFVVIEEQKRLRKIQKLFIDKFSNN